MTVSDQNAHQFAWDQIPWLLNGTLSSDEAAVVQAHILTCPECAAEMESQQRLSEVLRTIEAPVPNQALALEHISTRLGRQAPARGVFGQAIDALTGLGTRMPIRFAVGGAVAAAAVVMVLTTQAPDPQFETLTSPTTPANGVEIRLRYQADADLQSVKDLMVKAGATDITGPSDTGLLRGIVTDEIADAFVKQLQADPRVIFITKDR